MDGNILGWGVRFLMPGSLIWRINTRSKVIYLTFDDGPTGPFTHEILDLLDRYKAKGTFFCVGENVQRNPHAYHEIIRRGHAVGNHTHNHLKGWRTYVDDYEHNVRKAASLIESRLFRPPYGLISWRQIQRLKKDFTIIMWTRLTMDYDHETTPGECLNHALKGIKPGSIVVFHDNLKSADKVRHALDGFLHAASSQGYRFQVLK